MAIFKPEMATNSSPADFHGVCEFGIVQFSDKSGQIDWADLFLEAKIKQKGSDYERTLQIKGSFERDGGLISGGACLKRLYQFFSEIGCEAGITVNGKWETASGEPISNIADYLNDNFIHLESDSSPKLQYIGYFYQEQPKVPGAKAYTRVWNKVMKNKSENKEKLAKDAEWMKSKGYIKEMTDALPNSEISSGLSGSGLANL